MAECAPRYNKRRVVGRLGDEYPSGDEYTLAKDAVYAWGQECGEVWAPLSHWPAGSDC